MSTSVVEIKQSEEEAVTLMSALPYRTASVSSTGSRACVTQNNREVIDLTENDINRPSVMRNSSNNSDASIDLTGVESLPGTVDRPTQVTNRINRLDNQRLYVLEQDDLSTGEGGLHKMYTVCGSTGQMCDVRIKSSPCCTCIDSLSVGFTPPCKHVLFVMIKVSKLNFINFFLNICITSKVLKVDKYSNLLYKSSLSESELEILFNCNKSFVDLSSGR